MNADEIKRQITAQYKLLLEARDKNDNKAIRRAEQQIAYLNDNLRALEKP